MSTKENLSADRGFAQAKASLVRKAKTGKFMLTIVHPAHGNQKGSKGRHKAKKPQQDGNSDNDDESNPKRQGHRIRDDDDDDAKAAHMLHVFHKADAETNYILPEFHGHKKQNQPQVHSKAKNTN